MKKGFRFTAIIIAAFLLLFVGTIMAETEYYASIQMENGNLFPGQDAVLNLYMYVDNEGSGKLSIPYELKLYRFTGKDLDSLDLAKSEQDIVKSLKPVEVRSEKIDFRKTERYRNYESRNIKFTDLKPGIYFANLEIGNAKDSATFTVSSSALSVKSSPSTLLIYAQSMKNGTPEKGFEAIVKSGMKLHSLGFTDDKGMVSVKYSDLPPEITQDSTLQVIVRRNEELLAVPVHLSKETEVFKSYTYTDRPVYRPSQTVHFKSILRNDVKGELFPIVEEEAEVIIEDPRGGKVYEKTLKTNKFGSLSDSLLLGEEPPLGAYRVVVRHKTREQRSTFQVEEYRKPDMEITLVPLKMHYVQGSRPTFEMNARYYFGAPVADSEFTYTVTRRPHYPLGVSFDRLYHPGYRPPMSPSTVVTGTGKTDAAGRAVISFDTEKLNQDCSYSLVVSITDESRRKVSGSGNVVVTRGAYYISLTMDRLFYKPADRVRVNISSREYSGTPVSRPVDVRVERRLWTNRSWTTSEILKKTVTTDKEGRGSIEFVPDRTGYFTVTASSVDDHGNSFSSTTTFIAAEKTRETWYRASDLEIQFDKNSYNYGENMKLMLAGPDEGITALVTLEGEDIYDVHLVNFDSPVQVLEFAARPEFAPRMYVTVSYWKDGVFRSKTSGIHVSAQDRFLDVSLESSKKKYEPREKALYTIRTLNKKGQPVSCEVSLGVVDESIYAVHPDGTLPIQVFFYGYRANRVTTLSSMVRQPYPGRGRMASPRMMEAGVLPPPMTKSKAEAADSTPDKMQDPAFIREFFPDTAYFNAGIITDEKGRATVNFSFPDSLTTWRATARASSLKTEVGESTDSVTVSKDVLVTLMTPRFLIERDRTTITAMVHNNTDTELESLVKLSSQGAEITDVSEKRVHIKPRGKRAVHWRVETPKTGSAKFTVHALTKHVSDAMTLTVPVHPHGVRMTSAEAGSTGDTLTLETVLPENASKDTAVLQVNMSPSLAGTLINSLEYLAGYPYGCVEQTMSRFMPNAVVQSALREFGISNPKLEAELPKMMKKGLDRLYDFQHSDGGWGWWKHDKSHPHMTAYVVYGLTLAKKAGYSIDENRIKRGIDWLVNNYRKVDSPDTKAYMLFALSEAGVYEKDSLLKLFDSHPKLNNYSLAITAVSLHRAGLKSQASQLLQSLGKKVKETSLLASWGGDGTYSWSDNTVETTSWVVKAYLEIDPDNPLAEKGVRYLTSTRRGHSWYSTKDTAAAILALIDYAGRTGEMNVEFTGIVSVNGVDMKPVHFTKKDIATGGFNVSIPGSELRSGANVVTVRKQGPGRVYLTTLLTYFTREDKIASAEKGIKVSREYYLVTRKPLKANEVSGKAGNQQSSSPRGGEPRIRVVEQPAEELRKLDSSEVIVLSPQDIIEVVVKVNSGTRYEYGCIEDMKPAGFEVEEARDRPGHWNRWYADQEFRDERVAFFATILPKGEQTFRYRLRAETPGEYRVLPSYASLMYVPGIEGRSGEVRIRVKDE